MLDQLISSTAGLVQTNLSLIGNSYPVTFVTDTFQDAIGWKKSEGQKEQKEQSKVEEDISVADAFDDAPSAKPNDYISVYSMIERTIKGERMPIYRWVWFAIGVFFTFIVMSMLTNHMVMFPWPVRLFVALYIINIGLYTDFTELNMIYYIVLSYATLFLYRVYLGTIDPETTIMPFHWDSILPLRTTKNSWTDSINSIWLYLPTGASGIRYNNIVLETQEYMETLKGTIPDYKELEGKFNLKPLYECFENHMINMNLPGFMPPPPDTSLQTAQNVIEKAKAIQIISDAGTTIKGAREILGKALNKDDLPAATRKQLEGAKKTLNAARNAINRVQAPKP
jgi:hypothetical protein